MTYKTFEDISVQGKKVLVRVDFNVPLDSKGQVSDDTRIIKTLPTIQSLVKRKARVILMSHLGRPKGKKDPKYSLKPVAERLSKLLKQPVHFISDCIGPVAKKETGALKNGEVALLENLRFYPEEEKNNDEFSASLASLADFFVSDAFGAAHRAHASTVGVAKYLPAVGGALLSKEIEYFDRVLEHSTRPFVAILGGAKVVDKIKVIENLMSKVDCLLIGGAMAYTFLKARRHHIGNSMFDAEGFDTAKRILEAAKVKGVQFILPSDHVIAETVTLDSKVDVCEVDIPDGWIGVDIGPKTIERFKAIVEKANTVIWNGPVGVFELEPFSKGTRELAHCLAKLKEKNNVTTVIGGGETAAAVVQLGLESSMSHVSTGGGASLEYLEGKPLPGIQALTPK
ncbi:MAG: phosphoglycerate kinase [Omnitrophica bacterium RIFCSPHIGHO2_02_FULL_49_9]|nr:MAG: phosphoglycerate kinase [Omnitrophica bacterium RIFCSPHIGHO2_02_FULL_49_9]OGW89846.1 MAG: phosphoglycerate kinase [Omnitrophica bacterium RIFCSPLOWO2_01_FULL_50_24]